MPAKFSTVVCNKLEVIRVRVSVQDCFISVLEVFVKIQSFLMELSRVPQLP